MLKTSNVAGSLAIAGPIDGRGEQFTISIAPDNRMYALLFGSWLVLLGFFWLIAMSLSQSRMRYDEVNDKENAFGYDLTCSAAESKK